MNEVFETDIILNSSAGQCDQGIYSTFQQSVEKKNTRQEDIKGFKCLNVGVSASLIVTH